jgi:uncharacterized protein Yka (UPF0111/DUF47 family)
MTEEKSILDTYVDSAREIADFLKGQRPELAERVETLAAEVVQAVQDLLPYG